MNTGMALVLAVIARMILGMLWYSPMMFWKAWMAAAGLTKEGSKDSGKAIAGSIIAGIIMAFILDMLIGSAVGFAAGAVIGLWAWLGFIATTSIEMTLYEKRPIKLYIIGAGYNLVALILMGGILAI